MTPLPPEDRALAARIDALPVTALHACAGLLCALGLALDTLEIALGTVLAAVFSAPPDPAPALQLSLLLAAVYAGAVFGAPVLGRAADRFGRRRVLVAVLGWIGLTSLAASACTGVASLGLVRLLSGLALGAYPPVMIAYLTDLLPAPRRGMLIFLVSALAVLGPPLGLLLVRGLTPLQPLGIEAWRWGFAGAGVAALAVSVAFLALPESPRWLLARARADAAAQGLRRFEGSRVLLASGPAAAVLRPAEDTAGATPGPRPWPFVAALYLLSPWVTVAFPLLSGAVLVQKGYRLGDTLLVVALSSFGPFVGTALAAAGVDRLERRLALALCAGAMLFTGLAFAAGEGPGLLVLAAGLYGLFSALYVPMLGVYSAELFPTPQRAASAALAWALNRLGAALMPLLLLPLLRHAGPLAMFAVIAVALIASLLLLRHAPPGRQRASLA